MNYLAHFYLSGTSYPLLVGNFIADFVKGNSINNYPEEIQHGIMLHRFIDDFTDSHPIVLLSKNDYGKIITIMLLLLLIFITIIF